jgi:mRNA interferase MazF
MRRGDIWLADLEPIRGSEASRRRPVILVSNDAANVQAERLGRGVITVVPATSNTTRIFPFQVLLDAGETRLDLDSKAQAEQLRSIDVSRLERHLGRLTPQLLWQLDAAIRLHLAL